MSLSIKPEDAPPATALYDWIQSEKDLAFTEALSLGFSPTDLEDGTHQRTLVLDAMRYADKDNVRWGVGARLTLHAWSDATKIKGAVALVAAQASLNMAYTRTTFQVQGYNSADLAASMPSFQEMSVSNYADLIKAIDVCKTAVMSAKPEDLSPQPFAVSLPARPKADGGRHLWNIHIHHRQGAKAG